MNGINHKQAIKWIDHRLDGLLSESQSLTLEHHLRSCDSCSLYASEMDSLPAHLQNEFHVCWDEKPGPSPKVMEHVTTKARRIPMMNRISSGLKLVASVAALVLLGFFINLVVSQLRNTSVTATGNETENVLPRAEDRLLAFTSDQNGNFDIYTMHADGSGLTNLTNNPANDSSPFWSPDGKRIAFVSNRDGFMHIYLMDPDGSNVIQLTEDEADHEIGTKYGTHASPWSPDGSKLIFTQRAVGETQWILYVMDASGENQKPLVDELNIYSYPAWSPDGQHIAFLAGDAINPEGPRLYVVDADGSNLRDTTESLPAGESLWAYIGYYWSSDGQSIFFIAYRHIDEGQDQWIAYEANLDGNELVEKATSSTPMGDWWEGTSFITGFGDIKSPLTWLRSDGTFSTLEPLEKCQIGDENQYGATYERSANGNLVIAARCPIGNWWLYWANPDGTVIEPLLNSPISATSSDIMGMVWSPDDRYLALNITMAGKTYMSILNIEEALNDPSVQPVQTVIGGGSLFYAPSWRPIP